MFEILLFFCVLAIIIPSLFATSIVFNINRQIQGKPALSTEEAIKESFRLSLKKARQFVNWIKLRLNMKVKEAKQARKNKVDDAEFRDA